MCCSPTQDHALQPHTDLVQRLIQHSPPKSCASSCGKVESSEQSRLLLLRLCDVGLAASWLLTLPAQWPSWPQLWQVSSCAGLGLPAAPPRASPPARPCAPAWASLRALRGLPRLRPPVVEEDSPSFLSPWQESHCSRVRSSFPPVVMGPERDGVSSVSTTLRRPIASSIVIVERSSRD